ncbi:Uncharacterised protein [Legionella steigerwaltii]|uniref:Secreted protein n=2 Tax=Legionella steigerwaltii TaxID=460 RepID=A0A378L4B1_9GAMM|nr:hypothetical protein Lstg_2237 [Legionella steigerwaltii]STY21636.1 Uncharacterised protein [Legionella steigerwaltii]
MSKTTLLSTCILGLTLMQAGCVTVQGTTSNSAYSTASYDDSSNEPSPPIDNSASDTSAMIQQQNDINAMNASMAAAEQQNEAAQQQTLQTEINAMPIDNSNQW